MFQRGAFSQTLFNNQYEQHMTRTTCLHIGILLLSLNTLCNGQAVASKDVESQGIYLPSAIAAYTFFIQTHLDTLWRTQECSSVGIRLFQKLESVFDSAHADFNNELMFVRQAVFADERNSTDTIVQEVYEIIPPCPRYGTLYISTLGNPYQTLLILSSVAPLHTLILLLDSIPSARMIFDSFKDTNWYDGYGALGAIIKVKKGPNERFYLYESVLPEEWQTQFFPRKQRIFILDFRRRPVLQLLLGNK
jgi:hypothetical protein